MTPQEQQMIDGLISRIRNTPVQGKDSEAEQHIQQSLAGTPDALYVLVQTVLVQQYGLGQAQSQLTEAKQQNQILRDQLQQAADHAKSTGGSFLSHIFGSGGSQTSQPQPTAGNPPYQPVNTPPPTQGYPGSYAPPPPPPPVYQAGYPAPGGGGMFGGGGGGFLQGAMQTAAGVAAGEMVFQGMEGLFHGFGGHGYGGGFGGGGETIINNNYGDDDRAGGRDRDFADRGDNDRGDSDRGFYNTSDDASRNDTGNDLQAGSDIGNFGGDSFDNSTDNDLSLDDNSGGDDFSDSDNS